MTVNEGEGWSEEEIDVPALLSLLYLQSRTIFDHSLTFLVIESRLLIFSSAHSGSFLQCVNYSYFCF